MVGLVGDLNPLGRFENFSHNSLLMISTSGQNLFPFKIISKYSFLAAIIKIKMCLRSICLSRRIHLSYSFAVLFTEEVLQSQSVYILY